MEQQHDASARSADREPRQSAAEADDLWFGGHGPLDADTADGPLALRPPFSRAGDDAPYSWRCPSDDGTPETVAAHPEVPGSMDFPQHGDGRCGCGQDLVFRPRPPGA